jgi:hypothetical protein
MFKKMLEKLSIFSEEYENKLEQGQLSSTKEQLESFKELKKIPIEKATENFERKIGEQFDYEGTTLEVVPDTEPHCSGCFFVEKGCEDSRDIRGSCTYMARKAYESVKFLEVSKKPVTLKIPKNLIKFPHYFAKVPNFTHLDIYMVSEMFKLNSYQHHAVKKLVATGKRGAKDQVKDLEEVIVTVKAWIEVIKSEEV